MANHTKTVTADVISLELFLMVVGGAVAFLVITGLLMQWTP